MHGRNFPQADMNPSRGRPGTAAVAAPTGTQAVDRAAQLLIRVVNRAGVYDTTFAASHHNLVKFTP